jgi:ABC-2 type transport system ATP-binding protein
MNTIVNKLKQMNTSDIVLEINHIKKNYKQIQALKGVTFTIPKGTVFGILGPNGSGKTTLLGIVLDVLKASDGQYTWTNFNTPQEARQKIGSLLETPNFYHYLNAVDNLKVVCKIKNIDEQAIDEVLKKVNLYDRRFSLFSSFSLGMKQRLAIGSALLGNPDILVLDEPTNGLDPVGITEIRTIIKNLHAEGKTIIMASHMLDEVEKVCTHVAILKFGNLLMSGNVNEVLSNEDWVEISSNNNNLLYQALANCDLLKNSKQELNSILVSLKENATVEMLNKYCFEKGQILTHIQTRKRSLESRFMELTN